MRLAILGNSGSGKSTLARWAAAKFDAHCLDLDTVAWEPGEAPVLRDSTAARAEIMAFCESHERWVVEGCYGSLIAVTLTYRPRLVLLNPGEAQCLANCRTRDWEPHKYASRELQNERLSALLAWVRDYYARADDMSLIGHQAVFRGYAGPKLEMLSLPGLDDASAELLARLA